MGVSCRSGEEVVRLPTIPLEAAELAYDVRGSGPVVLQLHGLTSSRRRDEVLRLDLTRGLRDRTVVRYDARGHGRSTGRPVPEDYRWSKLAEDLLGVCEVVSPVDPVGVVGQSMGAATALHAVTAAPHRVDRLVLALPPTAWETRVAQGAVYRAGADLVETRGAQTWAEMSHYAPRPPAVDPEVPVTDPDVREAVLPSLLRGAGLSDLPDHERIAAIAAPTLVLAWEGDAAHPLSTARQLAALIPRSRLVVASTPAQVAAWPVLVAQHLVGDLSDPGLGPA